MSKLLETSKKWWEEINGIDDMKDYVKQKNQDIQFNLTDDQPFFVHVHDGKVTVVEGKAKPDIYNVLNLEIDSESLLEMYRGKKSYADLIIEEKLIAHEMAKRATLTWVGKTIRLRKELGSPLCI